MFYRSWIKSGPLKPGQSFASNHWESFQEERRKHNENICHETNKLVLRLDKLLSKLDEGGKPELDKSIVEWTSDELVKLCPFCAKTFTIARRRHHCRPCGAVLCNGCSLFLDYQAASKLVRPAKLYADQYDRIEAQLRAREAEEKPRIRTCEDCWRLLGRRLQTIEDCYGQPAFLDFYEKLKRHMREADELMLSKRNLLEDQKDPSGELVAKIQDLKQSVIKMSAKLSQMVERESSTKQAYLLSSVHQSLGYWLRESLESKADRVYGSRGADGASTGWVPEQPSAASKPADDEDPLLIQIHNLEEYIRQARLADRYEEVRALEDSKRDLEIEYLIQQEPPPPPPSPPSSEQGAEQPAAGASTSAPS